MTINGTKIKKVKFAPGINKNTTELDSEGTYVSCDKIRFFYGEPEKIGGWQIESYTGVVSGIARHIHTWTDLDDQEYMGFGTNQKLYVFTGGVVTDITPIVASASASNVINTSIGSTTVIVSVNPQGAQAGDHFVFATVTASAGGISFTSTYEITSVGSSHIQFEASTTAAATSIGAGGTVIVDYLLPTGLADNGAAAGWGGGTWGTYGSSVSAGWGNPRGGAGVSVGLRQWSTDNYGEDYFACPRGGKIYRWNTSAGTEQRAQLLTSAAPSVVNIMTVAQEGRHVLAFGTHDVSGDYDPMRVRWSDSEDYTQWTAAATNQAGEFTLEKGSLIIGVKETKKEVLIFTDENLYAMQRIGGDLVFSFRDLGKHSGLMSQHAAEDINGVVYWWGFHSFQSYNGVINTLPCSLQEYLFNPDSVGSVNKKQKEKIYCFTNRQFNEITWLYPSRDSIEIDRYVTFNYLENVWYYGTMNRTVWHEVGVYNRPYAIDTSGNIYIHEQGKNADTSGMKVQLVTSYFDIEDGDSLMFVDRHIPDHTINKDLNVTYKYKKYPQGDISYTKGPYVMTSTTKQILPRIRGRQMQIKYSTSTQGADFRIGAERIAVKPDGRR